MAFIDIFFGVLFFMLVATFLGLMWLSTLSSLKDASARREWRYKKDDSEEGEVK